MIIKIGGMQHANDVKRASQIGVDLLGFDFKYDDFTLEGYDPLPHIKAEVSV